LHEVAQPIRDEVYLLVCVARVELDEQASLRDVIDELVVRDQLLVCLLHTEVVEENIKQKFPVLHGEQNRGDQGSLIV